MSSKTMSSVQTTDKYEGPKPLSFIKMIDKLFEFWASKGSVRLYGYDQPVGAGTWHPEVVRNSLMKMDYNISLIQPCRRPNDARNTLSNNRIYLHHQYQLLISPIPSNIEKLVRQSFEACGISRAVNSIKFRTGDWCSPSMGAFGRGWEMECNGSEIGQYTYFEQILDLPVKMPPVEIAYGLERMALIVQNKASIFDLVWDEDSTGRQILWGDLRKDFELEFSGSRNSTALRALLDQYETLCYSSSGFYPAYEAFTAMSNAFNSLESTGINYSDRETLLRRVREAGKFCGKMLENSEMIERTSQETQ